VGMKTGSAKAGRYRAELSGFAGAGEAVFAQPRPRLDAWDKPRNRSGAPVRIPPGAEMLEPSMRQ